MVNLRPALAIGTAVLAAVVGTVGTDASGIVAASPASAAEDRSDLVSSRPAVQVTNRELRRVDSIELDAESLVFRDGDDTVADVSMRDSRSTVDLLGRLLGTPSRTQTAAGDGGACFPPAPPRRGAARSGSPRCGPRPRWATPSRSAC